MANSTEKSAEIKFYSIEEFKTRVGLSSEQAQVIKNPNTEKLFLSIGSQSFKCQAGIDPSKEMKMLVDNGNFDDACLTNIKASAENVLFTL